MIHIPAHNAIRPWFPVTLLSQGLNFNKSFFQGQEAITWDKKQDNIYSASTMYEDYVPGLIASWGLSAKLTPYDVSSLLQSKQ